MTTTARSKLSLKYRDTIGLAAALGRGFQLPVDLAVRSDGRIYVISRCAYEESIGVRVGSVDLNHDYYGHFGGNGSGDGQMDWPTAIAFDSADRLYLADERNHRITIFDGDGEFLDKWGEQGDAPGQVDGPSGLAFDSNDNLYVVDHKNNRVQRFTASGDYLSGWGEAGDGPGQFNLPWGIAVDSADRVYVADWRNDRIQMFTPGGEFVSSFGSSGHGDGELHRPADVTVDAEGFVYVADWGNQRVVVFDADGVYQLQLRGEATLSKWAEEYLAANADEFEARKSFDPYPELDVDDPHEVSARTEPYFWDPVSIEIDPEGRLYVLETNRHRFQVYEKE